jgi:three-Cys-motif partner protein
MKIKTFNYNCKNCTHEDNTNEGICQIKKGSDSLEVLCAGKWVLEKHYYLSRYLDLFTKAMANRWKDGLLYIDLFSGPGKCINRGTGDELDGSPLIALNYKFDRYIFVEKNKNSLDVLTKRCKAFGFKKNVEYMNKDCNNAIHDIKSLIPKDALSIAFIDPFGLDFNFENYELLTSNRRVDLIINFPIGMAIKRNLKSKKLDSFLGGDEWRKNNLVINNNISTNITNYFKVNLKKLGYVLPREYFIGDVVVKSSQKVPLYYLVFASKHPLGSKFWDEIRKYDPFGQRNLFS